MRATRGAVMHWDASNAWVESNEGSVSLIPPNLTGSARRSHSDLEQTSHPVREGMKCWWMAVSR